MVWDNTSWGVQSLPKDSIPKIQENLSVLYNAIGSNPDFSLTVPSIDLVNASLANAKTYTDTKLAAMVDSAPTTLDTLKELADALGDDPNFATTITTLIGTKAPLTSPTFIGSAVLPQNTSIGTTTATELGYLHGVTSGIQSQLNLLVPKASPVFSGNLATYMTGVYDSSTKRYIDFAGDFTGTNPSTTPNAGAFTGIRLGNIQNGKYAMIGSVSEDTSFGYSRATGLSFWTSPMDTAPSEHMRITAYGNVGIGLTSPQSALHAKGTILASQSNNENRQIALSIDDTSHRIQAQDVGIGVQPLSLNPYGGDVGVGTHNPQSKLHVQGADIRVSKANEINKQIVMGVNSTSLYSIQAVEQSVGYRALVLNPYGGNIGIGTDSPTKPLCVNAVGQNDAIGVMNGGTLNSIIGSGPYGVGIASMYIFDTLNSKSILVAKSTGVGIGGVDNPQANLHSAGSTILGISRTGLAYGNIGNSQMQISLSESDNKLWFDVRRSDGTLKSGYVQLA